MFLSGEEINTALVALLLCTAAVVASAFVLKKRKMKKRAAKIQIRQKDGGVVNIAADKLVYIEKSGDLLIYCLSDGSTITCIGTFEEAMRGLHRYRRFISPHSSYIINAEHMSYMADVAMTEVMMSNGAAVPVSDGQRAVVTAAFLRYRYEK